ncbi:MAG: alpha/beta hydrolase [Caldilineaceae bacterium]|nr:alpha/beta hydrolase [Caldilineaceae bacterium]
MATNELTLSEAREEVAHNSHVLVVEQLAEQQKPHNPAVSMPKGWEHIPQTLTLQRPFGRVVVDRWLPRHPSSHAPVLLIHGWGASGSYWGQTANALAETVPVIVPDLPGTGRSLPVQRAQRMADQVATLVSILDELQIDRVQVVGHSMGGAMALLLADALPDRVERLVLTSTCFFLDEEQVRFYRTIMKATYVTMTFRPKWLADLPFVKQFMATRYFYRVPRDPELLRQGLMEYLTLDYATAVACANDASDPAIPAAGTRLQVPALLIACRQDEVMPVDNVDYTLQMIPNSSVRWIDECGHMPMVEQFSTYLAYLREFLVL